MVKTTGLILMRPCKKCGVSKSDEDFRPISKNHTWQRHVCKECESLWRRKWNKENLAKLIAYRHKSRDKDLERAGQWNKTNAQKHRQHCLTYYYRQQDKAIMAYGGYKCACCGETEPLFLSLDHIENDGSSHRKSIGTLGGAKLYKWLEQNNYPPGFQVLCANCNHGKYRNKGICPHNDKERATTRA